VNGHARHYAAIILAFGVTATLIITALGAALHSGSITETESTLLSTALGAAVGAVATYLGTRSSDPPQPPEQPRFPAELEP